jgi:hypothetical protein
MQRFWICFKAKKQTFISGSSPKLRHSLDLYAFVSCTGVTYDMFVPSSVQF